MESRTRQGGADPCRSRQADQIHDATPAQLRAKLAQDQELRPEKMCKLQPDSLARARGIDIGETCCSQSNWWDRRASGGRVVWAVESGRRRRSPQVSS